MFTLSAHMLIFAPALTIVRLCLSSGWVRVVLVDGGACTVWRGLGTRTSHIVRDTFTFGWRVVLGCVLCLCQHSHRCCSCCLPLDYLLVHRCLMHDCLLVHRPLCTFMQGSLVQFDGVTAILVARGFFWHFCAEQFFPRPPAPTRCGWM